jgi:Ca2+-transporting ATPase
MTGDGINDGPALRAANVSVAMGADSADVAREVADVVLASNDLGGIVQAVRLGRATHANIRKVLRYLISTSATETLAMLGAAMLDGGVAMTSTQLLWLNIAGEPLPALALGLERPEEGVLNEPPHDPRAPILSPSDFRRLIFEGTVIGASALAGYYLAGGARNPARASTITFHSVTLGELVYAISCRSETPGFYRKLVHAPNPKLTGALLISATAQAAAQLFPGSRRVLSLAPMGWADFLSIAAIIFGGAATNNLFDYLIRPASQTPRLG